MLARFFVVAFLATTCLAAHSTTCQASIVASTSTLDTIKYAGASVDESLVLITATVVRLGTDGDSATTAKVFAPDGTTMLFEDDFVDIFLDEVIKATTTTKADSDAGPAAASAFAGIEFEIINLSDSAITVDFEYSLMGISTLTGTGPGLTGMAMTESLVDDLADSSTVPIVNMTKYDLGVDGSEDSTKTGTFSVSVDSEGSQVLFFDTFSESSASGVSAIPEPATSAIWAVLGVGGAFAGWRKRRWRRAA